MSAIDVTCVACLTPAGRGAIATLGVRGPQAWTVLRELFRPVAKPLPPDIPQAGRFFLGKLSAGAHGDEVVLAVKRQDPPWLEVHCHGGPEVVRWLLEVLAGRGLRICSWQEVEQLLGGDPWEVAAKIELARAPTVRTASILLDQYHGAWRRTMADLGTALREDAAQIIDLLLAHEALGRHLTTPWRVVIAGAPNVGKSSLVNALAGYQRSLVAATPGTTRDVVTTLLAIDGWPVEIADTAGWRTGADALEQEGIARAQQTMMSADLCLWVVDGSAPPVLPAETAPALRYVINKVDLPAAWEWNELAAASQVSARTGSGMADLCEAVSRWLVPHPPAPGTAVPFTSELCEILVQTQRLLRG